MTSPSRNPLSENDVRPAVRTGYAGNRSIWLFAAAVGIGGLVLFSSLEARRQQIAGTTSGVQGNTPISAPPELVVPSSSGEEYAYREGWPQFLPRSVPSNRESASYIPATVPQRTNTRARSPSYPGLNGREEPQDTVAQQAASPRSQPFNGYEPPETYYNHDPGELPPTRSLQTRAATTPTDSVPRVRAGRLANPADTVPQGTVIPAVLETALDSTRAGAVRAIVSRDVRGFDGTRVLIARGSRLYGEYNSSLYPGQNRALVQWKRLIRPDGVSIALDSPASDPLGRAGIRGRVKSNFLQRFGGAILQSALDIGVGLATRQVDRTVVVGLPGTVQSVAGAAGPLHQVQRTLTVRHGTSVSVFVARDLDFSTQE